MEIVDFLRMWMASDCTTPRYMIDPDSRKGEIAKASAWRFADGKSST